MKVKIGKYKHFIGPYQIADMIPFVSEDTQDKIGDFLSRTFIADVCSWIDGLRGGLRGDYKRHVDVRIDSHDTWNADHTLALIILPTLKQLKATKHGSPYVDDEDVPAHMRHSDPRPELYGADNWTHYKWEWILNEMIFAFENIADDSWKDRFFDSEGNFDRNVYQAYQERIQNGTRLFGKYYQALWD